MGEQSMNSCVIPIIHYLRAKCLQIVNILASVNESQSPFTVAFGCVTLRCQLIRSHQHRGIPPVDLLLPLCLLLISCLWPNYWRHHCLSCSSTDSTPVPSIMSLFLTLFQRVIREMFLRHLD